MYRGGMSSEGIFKGLISNEGYLVEGWPCRVLSREVSSSKGMSKLTDVKSSDVL